MDLSIEHLTAIRTNAYRERGANIRILLGIVSDFSKTESFEIFKRGMSAGQEAMTWQSGAEVEFSRKRTLISRIANMPAWEGSHAGRYLEHDPVYSIGAVVGAFIFAEGLEIDEVIENV